MDATTTRAIRLCALDELPVGGVWLADVEPPVAVFNVGGELLAVDDTCTHGEAPLSEGYVLGDQIECPWHQGRFCLRTGRAMTPPPVRALRTYRVELRADEVWLHV